jgi:UDP-glucose 4-epimerase|tara:strand:- start:73 stop:987 length:915 start_codon:yes stop_codon:yes gene_type:complete
MKALVTGGAGFVGTNLIKKLLSEGHDVVSVDNYSSGLKENEQEGCKYLDMDLAVTTPKHGSWGQGKFQLEKPDTIFHIAALARIQTSLREPHHHINNNFVSTLNVLEYARENDIPVVYAGSSSKHHGVTGSPYAWVKWSGEELCKLYSDVYNVPTSICRFYNVYGPHQLIDGPYCTVVGIFMEQYKKGEPLTITGDGEQRRDFTHVDDIVDGLYSCMRAMHGEVDMRYAGAEWEFGRGVNHSINELASYFGSDYPTKYIPARSGEYDITLCDDENTREGLGYNPSRNLEDYIKDFVETERFFNE